MKMRIERNTSNPNESKEIANISTDLATLYINREFGNTVKITTFLNKGCWTGKVLIESVNSNQHIGKDDAEFYASYILSSVSSKEKLEKIIKNLQEALDE